MTEQIRDGGPAFPTDDYNVEKGMSLRDWLAGRAMQSLVGGTGWAEEIEHIAIRSYQMADAMLKQREAK